MFSFTTPSFQQPIQGNLPFGGGRSSGYSFNNPQAITASYQQAYNNALQMNQSNYNNILQGYQQALSAHTSAQQAIQGGYNDLYNQVLGKLEGQGQATARRINDSSAQFLAAQTQGLTDKGLGNTTITSSVGRGVEADRQQRLQENDESVAKMMADYMSNLGTRRLEGSRQGQDSITGLALNQLGFMNSVQAKYPNFSDYAGLAQQAAAGQGSGAGGGAYGGGSFAGGGGAGPKIGYTPGAGPYYGSGGMSPGFTGTGGGYNAFAVGAGGGGYGDFGGNPFDKAAVGAGVYGDSQAKLPVDYGSFYSGAGRNTFGGGGGYGTTTPTDYGYGADTSLWGY